MSDTVLTITLSDEELAGLRGRYPGPTDEDVLAQLVEECQETAPGDEQDVEVIVARLRRDFPDDPMVQMIGAISVPVDESPADHHDLW